MEEGCGLFITFTVGEICSCVIRVRTANAAKGCFVVADSISLMEPTSARVAVGLVNAVPVDFAFVFCLRFIIGLKFRYCVHPLLIGVFWRAISAEAVLVIKAPCEGGLLSRHLKVVMA